MWWMWRGGRGACLRFPVALVSIVTLGQGRLKAEGSVIKEEAASRHV
jgi:hypothetical protein